MKAILQVADTGPLESLVVMLRSVGVECLYPSYQLRQELRRIGMTLVLEVEGLMKGWGYDRPFDIPPAELGDMDRDDVVYVDVKAHRDYAKVVRRWPNLADRVLWYRIQGGQPEHVVKPSGEDCGDEVNPPCPVLTPNLWYRCRSQCEYCGGFHLEFDEDSQCCGKRSNLVGVPWEAYSCWPPFHRFDEYVYPRPFTPPEERSKKVYQPSCMKYEAPLCLIHNLAGWGYGALVENVRKLGVLCYGAGSPDGLIQHREIKVRLTNAVAMVHLKSSDAPGYALYEALAASCPVVCSRRLIWRNRMQDLFIPGETCLVFDRETHDGLSEKDVDDCTKEIAGHLKSLADPAYNRRIGEAGRERLRELMWSESKPADVASLRSFIERHFKC